MKLFLAVGLHISRGRTVDIGNRFPEHKIVQKLRKVVSIFNETGASEYRRLKLLLRNVKKRKQKCPFY